MPSLNPSDPLTFWLAAAFLALLMGLAGGVGGRWWKTRLDFAEVWDVLDAHEKRLAKRDGQAGSEAKKQRASTAESEAAEAKQLLSALLAQRKAGPQLVREDDPAWAAKHFAALDGKAGG